MKALQTLSLVGILTLSTSLLNANIKMSLEESCKPCTKVIVVHDKKQYVEKIDKKDGKLTVTFSKKIKEGWVVTPYGELCDPPACIQTCFSQEQFVKDGGTLTCTKPD